MEKIGIGKELIEENFNFDKYIKKICEADCKNKYSSQKKIEECVEGCNDIIAIF